MGRLFGYMANRSDRLLQAIDDELSPLLSVPPHGATGWGLGFFQGGEVLHKKRPMLEDSAIDWSQLVRDVRTDCAIFHIRQATVGDFRAENTHPFRMRNWLFAHNGTVEGFAAIRDKLRDSLPDFLRRGIQGETDSEHFFSLILAKLHDLTAIDHLDVDAQQVVGAIRAAVRQIDGWTAEIGAAPSVLNCLLTNGRMMFGVRRGAPMAYAERHETDGPSPALHLCILSDENEAPVGYQTVGADSILVVSRELRVAQFSLRG